MSDETTMPAITEAAPVATPEIPAVAPVVERKAVEHWAQSKGHTKTIAHPELIKSKGAPVPVETVLDWRFACAKAHERWPLGHELTEQQYDEAIATATSVALR